MNLTGYQTLVFDCDGVVLNSNKVKTDAFYKAALPYGELAAQQLVDYHIARGGISRYKKFEWFLTEAVMGRSGPGMEMLLESYAAEVRKRLSSCEIAEGLFELRSKTEHTNWLIVSGGDQQELREIFAERGLAVLFDGGIFGSPESKDVILNREKAKGNIKEPALFLGDSRYDHLAASAANLDFIFLVKWSEFRLWPEYCHTHRIETFESLASLT